MRKRKGSPRTQETSVELPKGPWLNYTQTIVAVGGALLCLLCCSMVSYIFHAEVSLAYWISVTLCMGAVIALNMWIYSDRGDILQREITHATQHVQRQFDSWVRIANKHGVKTPRLLDKRLGLKTQSSEIVAHKEQVKTQVSAESNNSDVEASKIRELQLEVQRLESEIGQKSNSISQSSRKIQELGEQVKGLEKTLARRDKTILELRSVKAEDPKLKSLQADLDTIRAELSAKVTLLEETQTAFDAERNELQSTQSQLEDARTNISKLENELREVSQLHAEKEEAVQFFAGDNQRLKKDNDQLRKDARDASALDRRIDREVDNAVEPLNQRIASQSVIIEQLEREKAELQDVKNRIEVLESENTKLQSTSERVEELESTNEELRNNSVKLSDEIAQVRQELGAVSGDLQIAQNKLADKTQEAVELERERDQLQIQVEQLTSKVSELEQQASQITAVDPALQMQLDEARDEVETLEKDLETLREELRELVKEGEGLLFVNLLGLLESNAQAASFQGLASQVLQVANEDPEEDGSCTIILSAETLEMYRQFSDLNFDEGHMLESFVNPVLEKVDSLATTPEVSGA